MGTMPHAKKWGHTLSDSYGDQEASARITRAQTYYDHYSSQYAAQTDRSNWKLLKSRVLPGLSIYKALLEMVSDQEKVLAEVDNLFKAAFFTRLLQGIRWLNYLPSPFIVLRPVPRIMIGATTETQEIVEDNADCFAVNVYRCFILDTLAEHGAAELAVLYCNMDDWLSEGLSKVSWERTKTLARGADHCDFRWCRIRQPA